MEERYELQKKFDEITNDDIDIYCHFTDALGEDILESGLFVGNKEWYKSFLKLDANDLMDICAFIDDNGNKAIGTSIMVVVAVFKDADEPFIRKSIGNDSIYYNWSGVNSPDYIVDSEYILGYVDVNTMELFVNNRSLVVEDLMIL